MARENQKAKEEAPRTLLARAHVWWSRRFGAQPERPELGPKHAHTPPRIDQPHATASTAALKAAEELQRPRELVGHDGAGPLALVLADRELTDSELGELRTELHRKGRAIDVVLSLGDLPESYILRVSAQMTAVAPGSADPPILAVKGNHDAAWAFRAPIQGLHGTSTSVAGLRIGGVGGCLAYKANAPHHFEDEDITRVVGNLPPVDVMIAHNSPLGVHDKADARHRGFAALRELTTRGDVRMLLHGHQHVDATTTIMHDRTAAAESGGSCQVVGVFGARLLSLPRVTLARQALPANHLSTNHLSSGVYHHVQAATP